MGGKGEGGGEGGGGGPRGWARPYAVAVKSRDVSWVLKYRGPTSDSDVGGGGPPLHSNSLSYYVGGVGGKGEGDGEGGGGGPRGWARPYGRGPALVKWRAEGRGHTFYELVITLENAN